VVTPDQSTAERRHLIHREILQLAVLIVLAVAAFLLTRALAASNRRTSLRDGAEWYERGQQQLDTGRVDDAIDSFRRATARNRNEKDYVLALARALTTGGDDAGARSALLALRESAPEDAEINLQLARLAAGRQDVTEALRYYRNALYAPWAVDQTDARRQVRFELIRFLLVHDQASGALSELLAVSTNLPDDEALHVQVAQLFAQAGDSRQALDRFQSALDLAPDSGRARAGAGLAAFQLGDYLLARRYLRSAPPDIERVSETGTLVELILANDPLASRIGSAERGRRLLANFSYAQQRLNTCLERPAGEPPTAEEEALQRDAQAFEPQLKPPAIREQDTVEAGVDLIFKIERQVAQTCPPVTPFDRAMILIGRQHGADER
jgi:tetratricopeptide (TPR) repeat protein